MEVSFSKLEGEVFGGRGVFILEVGGRGEVASLDALIRLKSDFLVGMILQLLEEDLVGVWVSDLRLGDFCVC